MFLWDFTFIDSNIMASKVKSQRNTRHSHWYFYVTRPVFLWDFTFVDANIFRKWKNKSFFSKIYWKNNVECLKRPNPETIRVCMPETYQKTALKLWISKEQPAHKKSQKISKNISKNIFKNVPKNIFKKISKKKSFKKYFQFR